MRYIVVITATVLAAGMLCGCVSRRNDVLMRLMREIEAEQVSRDAEAQGGDAPEQPVSALPPAPEELTVEGDSDRPTLTIQPDCLVRISVKEDPSLDGSYTVNEIGAVELGYVGPVILYNKTEKDAATKISRVLIDREFRTATVTVRIARASYDRVQVSGAVHRPGLIRIGAGDSISLNDALLRAGGLRPSARGAQVRIVRDGLRYAVVLSMSGEEYSLVDEDGTPSVPEVTLANNDVAFVFSSTTKAPAIIGEKEVTVLGEVKKKGVYRFSGVEPCTMMHLMFKMGGLPPYANKRAVKIMRRDENGIETELIIDVEKILETGNPEDDVELENGDRIIVPRRKIHLF